MYNNVPKYRDSFSKKIQNKRQLLKSDNLSMNIGIQFLGKSRTGTRDGIQKRKLVVICKSEIMKLYECKQ